MSLTDCPGPSYLAPASPGWLMEAIEDVVYRSGVRAPTIAERIGVSESALYHWASRPDNLSGKHARLHVDRLVPLTLASGNYTIVNALEAQLSRYALPLVAMHQLTLTQRGAMALEGNGAVTEWIGKALRDGEIKLGEGEAMLPAIDAAIEKLARLKLDITMLKAAEG